MATDPKHVRLLQPVTTPQRPMPPTARELRSHAVLRLQVGVFGLCAMLLMVGLANIVMDRARVTEAKEPVAEAIPEMAPTKPAADPLADIGVAPAADPVPEAESDIVIQPVEGN
jgi:hypothetical protein